MDNQDTIWEQFKAAAESQKPVPFQDMEEIWKQVEEKLEQQEKPKTILLWPKWLAAATLTILVCFTTFFLMRKKDNSILVKAPKITNNKVKIRTENKTIDSTKTIIASIPNKTNKLKKRKTPKDFPQFSNEHDDRNTHSLAMGPKPIENAQTIPTNKETSIITAQGLLRTPAIENRKEVASTFDQKAMDEVVVIGYGTQKKKDITGAIASAPSIIAPSNRPLMRALSGRTAGLAITKIGNPGAANSIQIRGANTFNTDKQPIIILNGKLVPNSILASVKTDDINNVTILKDQKATALYGSSAPNGAVVITTKNPTSFSPKENTESYETYQENAFTSPVTSPFSTFSIDVDNASYTNIRRFINNGQKVPKDAVRIEEMINFFPYHTPQPNNNDPFNISSEYAVAPWNPHHNLLKISLKGKVIPEDNLPAANLVFLIDVSGSMNEPNKLPLLKSSLKMLVQKLRKQDKVAIVTYAGNAGLVLPATPGNNKDKIDSAIDHLSAGGSTAGEAGILLAYKIAKENRIPGGNNRIILATDGDFNVGPSSDKEMDTLISQKRKENIFLTCLGFGMRNFKDSKIEILAQKGNGNYAYIDNIQEANRTLVKTFGSTMYTIAKDVKLQVEFNPSKVRAYRLIGYENRMLAGQDFANDNIDAGEMGSGHTVTALYEVIPNANTLDSFYLQTDTLRYKMGNTQNTHGEELAYIKTRYKKPEGEKSIEKTFIAKDQLENLPNISSDFRLASTVAWFGLLLRESKLIPDKNKQHLLHWAKDGQYDDPDGYIAELFRLIENAQ